jgi:hypothetical protein
MLDAGAAIVGGVLEDPLLVRWIETYSAMPAQDRPVIVEAVEREVKRRRVGDGVAGPVAQTMYPNPNAVLYVRTHEQEVLPERLVAAQMAVGMRRALRVMHLLTGTPKIHEDWLVASRAAVEEVDDDTRRVVAGVLRGLLDIVEELTTDRT